MSKLRPKGPKDPFIRFKGGGTGPKGPNFIFLHLLSSPDIITPDKEKVQKRQFRPVSEAVLLSKYEGHVWIMESAWFKGRLQERGGKHVDDFTLSGHAF